VCTTQATAFQWKELSASHEGCNYTYFAGRWTQGFTSHEEDTFVSGIEAATNDILKLLGLEPHDILNREIELHSAKLTPPMGDRERHESCLANAAVVKVMSMINVQFGCDVSLSDCLGNVGLTSLTVALLHGSMQEAFGLTNKYLPVSVFIEGETTIGDFIAKLQKKAVTTEWNLQDW
jgi:hypothetical protein